MTNQMSVLPRHGGDIAAAARRFGWPAADWLDLSTGINPFPYPLPAIAPECWWRLPDSAAEAGLRDAAAAHYGAADAAMVVAAPGSQALMQWLARLLPARRVVAVGPTYGGHGEAWTAAGIPFAEAAALPPPQPGLVAVVVNPNNPDGRHEAPQRLLAYATDLAAVGGTLIVDEAFADTMPAFSAVPDLGRGMVVLRSFGKFYGLAGLRLGFALAEPAFAETLRRALGNWPVAGPAIAVAAAALGDRAWAEATRARLAEAAAGLDQVLGQAGLTVLGGTSLFRLAAVPGAERVYAGLAERGILVRAFAQRADWLRFGLPGSSAGLERLRAGLLAAR